MKYTNLLTSDDYFQLETLVITFYPGNNIAIFSFRFFPLTTLTQWISLVLVKVGRDYVYPPRRQGLYLVCKRYILPSGRLYTTCHPLHKNQNNPLTHSEQNLQKSPDPVVVEQTEMERHGLSLRTKAGGLVDDCVGGWRKCYEVGPTIVINGVEKYTCVYIYIYDPYEWPKIHGCPGVVSHL